MEKRILVWEPCFFMFFGLFHLHRIWGLQMKMIRLRFLLRQIIKWLEVSEFSGRETYIGRLLN